MIPDWAFIVGAIVVTLSFLALIFGGPSRHGTNTAGVSRIAQQAERRRPTEITEWREAPIEDTAPRAPEVWTEAVREPGPINLWSDDVPAGFVPPVNVPPPPGMFGREVLG